MKKSRLFGILSILLVSLVFTTGCNNNNGTEPNLSSDLQSAQFAVLDYNDAMGVIIDPDLDHNPGFGQFPPQPGSLTGDGRGGRLRHGMGNRPGPENDNGLHLGRIFHELQLSDEQLSTIQGYLEAHRVDMQVYFEQMRELTADIMEYGKEQREAIIERVRNGELTREEARPLLDALGAEIRSMIEANEEVQTLKAQMCETTDALFNNIATLLDAVQLELWNTWLVAHPGPCGE